MNFPSTLPLFSIETEEPHYLTAIERIVHYLLPPSLLKGEILDEEKFLSLLPLIAHTPCGTPPFTLSFFLCSKYRPNSFRFFYEMLSRWLMPGRQTRTLLHFSANFSLFGLSAQLYTGSEILIRVENERELGLIQKNLPRIESDLKRGVESDHHARCLLETKGLTAHEQMAMIQENIGFLIQHRPQDFDFDIYTDMQHFLLLCKEEFIECRSYKHISRIICSHYLFRKALELSSETFPERRYISVKLLRTQVKGVHVLAIVLAISNLGDNEVIEERHLQRAIHTLLPAAEIVEKSFILGRVSKERVVTLYAEIESKLRKRFSLEEARCLKQMLPSELKNHIEKRLNPLFMPQNEEEIMRHIVTLSHELKYAKDLPQVVIIFNHQYEKSLEFFVIVLRIIAPCFQEIEELFKKKQRGVDFFLDRTKIVGVLRKKYQKEATLLRATIDKAPFFRRDHSVDLYQARRHVAETLKETLGEFRDYNGGTLSKEMELYSMLQKKIPLAMEHAHLLEEFFFSLSPPLMRSLLHPDPLKTLFSMLLEAKEEGLRGDQDFITRIQEKGSYLFFLVTLRYSSYLNDLLHTLKEASLQVTTTLIESLPYPVLGIIYTNHDLQKATKLRLCIELQIARWENLKN